MTGVQTCALPIYSATTTPVSVLSRQGVPDRRPNRRPPGHIKAPHDKKTIENATARWLERGLIKAPHDKKCRMSLVAVPSDQSAVCNVFTSPFAISSARLESRRTLTDNGNQKVPPPLLNAKDQIRPMYPRGDPWDVRSGIRTHASRGDCDLNAAP